MGANASARSRLKTMIAACKGFRDLGTPAWSNTTALTHIHIGALTEPAADGAHTAAELLTLRPFALIWTNDQNGLRWDQTAEAGASGMFHVGGSLAVRFERLVPAGTQPGQAEEDFVNELDTIMSTGAWPFNAANAGLVELHGQDGMLAFHHMEMMGPTRADEEQRASYGDYVRAWLDLEWGVV